MPSKSDRKPKLSDTERHKRFVEMAREVGTSNDPKDFDRAFDDIVMKIDPKKKPKPHLKST
jgi:hypothetical protein